MLTDIILPLLRFHINVLRRFQSSTFDFDDGSQTVVLSKSKFRIVWNRCQTMLYALYLCGMTFQVHGLAKNNCQSEMWESIIFISGLFMCLLWGSYWDPYLDAMDLINTFIFYERKAKCKPGSFNYMQC